MVVAATLAAQEVDRTLAALCPEDASLANEEGRFCVSGALAE